VKSKETTILSDPRLPAELTASEQEEILAELRWYGKTIAGGGPMIGFEKVGRRAHTHWYETTLPLLMKLGRVYAGEQQEKRQGSRDQRLLQDAVKARELEAIQLCDKCDLCEDHHE